MLRRAAPALLVLVLAAASLLPFDAALRLESGDPSVAERWAETLEGLPDDADVLVGFDPDLGTYAEIRPTARVLLADLLGRGARLAFISLTPEGRALAIAELARLRREGAMPQRIADFGFLPGAEAALVRLTRSFPEPAGGGALARRLVDEGMSGLDAMVVIGGNDLGPRSWVEQVAPRTDDVPLMAIAPTVLLPELQPYVATGQLDALAATPRDGAAYRASAVLGAADRLVAVEGPPVGGLLAGLIVAAVVLAQALVRGIPGTSRGNGAER